MSFGTSANGAGYCNSHPTDAWCVNIARASYLDVTMVASAGNNRTRIAFPANDPRVVDVGGFEQSLAIWDLSPGSTTNCPPANLIAPLPLGSECGSNYTVASGNPRQELMASASEVLSTTYP